jgi:large subunit ribosomal protein L23
MGLFSVFKKKPAFVKATAGKKKEEPEKKPEIKPERKKEQPTVSRSKSAYKVLGSPHVTEKATGLSESDQYIFKVLPRSNKIEIKKAIESLYEVKVEKIRIINIHRKKRRVGRTREGWKKGYKKAIVRIKKGQKIEIMPR